MDANQDAIESLLTGSPATLTALQKKIETLTVLTDQGENLNAKFALTSVSDDTSTTTTPFGEALSQKQNNQQNLQTSTPSHRIPSFAMKTPSLDIPTPALTRLNIDSKERSEKFFDTYESLYDAVEVALELPPTHLSETVVQFDDTDFFPIDLDPNSTPVRDGDENFHAAVNAQKAMSPSLISPQIQAMIEAAKCEGFEKAKQQLHQEITERVQMEAQKQLEECGAAWIKKHEEEVDRLQSQMNEMVEKHKTHLEQEFTSKMQSNAQNDASARDLIDKHEAKVNDLQKVINAMKDNSETEHIVFNGRILELESEVCNTKNDIQVARDDLTAADDRLKFLIDHENQKEIDLKKTNDEQLNFLNAELERCKIDAAEQMAEKGVLMSQINTGNQGHNDALIIERKAFQEKINQLEELLSRSREMHAAASADIAIKHAKGLENIKITCEEEVLSLANTWDQVKDKLRSDVEVLERRLSSVASANSKEIDKIKALHDVEVQVLNSDHEIHCGHLRDELALERAEALNRLKESSSREKDLMEKVSQLETETEQARVNSQLREQELSKEHAAEIDELISQLDLVEAESKKESTTLEATMKQKDAIVAALGTQLAEATSKINELEAEHQKLVDMLSTAKGEAHLAEIKFVALVSDMERSKMEHNNDMEEEKQKRNEACEKVRSEMIKRAEEQFAKANVEYLRVKAELEAAVNKIGRIERELRVVSTKFDAIKKEQATKEISMVAELAQAKAGEFFLRECLRVNNRLLILSSYATLSS